MTGRPSSEWPTAIVLVAIIAAATVICVLGPAGWWTQ